MSGTIPKPLSPGAAPAFSWLSLAYLIRFPNQSGTLLLMLPTLWSLTLAAHGRPPLSLLAIFIAGSFLMRSAGVILNDLADRSFDRLAPRTQMRPLASGKVTVRQALSVAFILVLCAGGLVLLLNPLAALLSPIGLLLAAVYPYAKRYIHVPQAVLGVAFGWGVIMAWAAVRASLDLTAWLLYSSVICWAIAYDTIYALQDRADDLRIGVRSSAIFFGSYTWVAVTVAFGAMLLFLLAGGYVSGLGTWFYVVLAAVGLFFSLQISKLRGEVTSSTAFTLFRQHVWVGGAVLAGIWLGSRY